MLHERPLEAAATQSSMALRRGRRFSGTSEPVHSFFIFNTEKARGPRRRVAMLEHRDVAERIIGVAIEVQRKNAPGLLESVCPAFIGFELEQTAIPLLRPIGIPVFYKG
jgi:hypothetical protein